MTTALANDADVASYEEARSGTDEIKVDLKAVYQKIIRAHSRKYWVALGYEDWESYVTREFPAMPRLPRADRPGISAEMYDAGMTTREVGAALGVTPMTISRDLNPVTNVTEINSPGEVYAKVSGVAVDYEVTDEQLEAHARRHLGDEDFESAKERRLASKLSNRATDAYHTILNAIADIDVDPDGMNDEGVSAAIQLIECVEEALREIKERVNKYARQ